MRNFSRKNRRLDDMQAGFTLLELLLVIALIGILASLAVSRYSRNIQQSNRRAAVAELYVAQQALERIRLQSGKYNGGDTLAVPTVKGYTFEFVISEATYLLKAVAGQGGDTDCGDLTIDQTDRRTAKGALKECWE